MNHACEYNVQFQPSQRLCIACEKILIGEFSNRKISWGSSNYHVREFLGGGGMGEVYRSFEENQAGTYRREVAIKFNKNMMDKDSIKRFELEMQILGMLQNPHNVKVYTNGELFDERATGVQVSAQFMVMELLKGIPLNERIKYQPDLNASEVIAIMIQVCGALSEAHKKGIIHRDLKPHNIMLQSISGDVFAKVFDYGLSRLTHSMDDRLSTTGVVMGTFRYMSPEQALGEEMDLRTDIFSLGVVMYEIFAKDHPFPVKNLFELFVSHQNGAAVIEGLEPKMNEIIHRCIAYEKDHRYQSMDELRAELQFLLSDSLAGQVMVSQISSYTNTSLTSMRSYEESSKKKKQISGSAGTLEDTKQDHAKTAKSPKKSRSSVFLLLAVLVLLLLVGALGWKLSGFSNSVSHPSEKTMVVGKEKPTKQDAGVVLPEKSLLVEKEPWVVEVKNIVPEQTKKKKKKKKKYVRKKRHSSSKVKKQKKLEALAIQKRKLEAQKKAEEEKKAREAKQLLQKQKEAALKVALLVAKQKKEKKQKEAKIIPKRPSCPSFSSWIVFKTLDQSLGSSLTSKVARTLNQATNNSVYDAGLRLSKSWRNAKVFCKEEFFCSQIKDFVQNYCANYQPRSDCAHYSVQTSTRLGKTFFRCVKK